MQRKCLYPVFQNKVDRRAYKIDLKDLYRTRCGDPGKIGVVFNSVNGYVRVADYEHPYDSWNQLRELRVTDYLRLGSRNASTCFLNGYLKKSALLEIQLQSAPLTAFPSFVARLTKMIGISTTHNFVSISINRNYRCSSRAV